MEEICEIGTRCKNYGVGKVKKTGGLVDQRKADGNENIDAACDQGIYEELVEHEIPTTIRRWKVIIVNYASDTYLFLLTKHCIKSAILGVTVFSPC